MKIMTFEQAFNYSMNRYPALWTATTLGQARLKYADHMFNVIGNGYRSMEEFLDKHTITPENETLIHGFEAKYIGAEKLFMAYTEVDTTGYFKRAVTESRIPGLYTEAELAQKPEVQHTILVRDRHENFVPYSNFTKEYSMVWRLTMPDISWLEAATDYYLHAQKFFESERSNEYYGAWPATEKEQKKMVADYEKAFEAYRTPEQTQAGFFAVVSKNYEREYQGDTERFIKEGWNSELERIRIFIAQTLTHIEALKESFKSTN